MIPAPSIQSIQAALDRGLGVKVRRVTKRVPQMNFGLIVAGRPPPPQYKTEVVEERTEQWSKLVGLLFCMPTSKPGKDEILPNLDYFHHRSALFVDFFCIGYGTEPSDDADRSSSQPVAIVDNAQWRFTPSEFNACRAEIESHTKWRFSGETDLLLAVARKPRNGCATLDYSSVIACNLEEMIRDNAIPSVRGFFEKIFQFGEQYSGADPVWKLSDQFGLAGGGKLLEESVLSLLPEVVKKQYKATKHLAISDVSR